MDLGLVKKVDIDREMQQSYLDYAMSVIVSRALPDARDGLKPVQRRILYAMYDMGIRPDTPYKKSARIVGEVLGKYHPHGDMAVYEAMARTAQDFSIRIPLVEGQGNFGSVDGDPPAAMRYTEARLTSFASELLEQIDQNTVEFIPNFDETLTEPVVLPAAAPNLLVNGASGIAVGMATNIPPHNLGEVIDALSFMLHEWENLEEVSVYDLMRYIKGPDFPTGGIILQEEKQNELLTAYATGRGKISVRGRLHVEEMSRGKSRIIITELPYLVNKSNLIERIAELVREGGLDGIADLRDESDRQGMRIVIELNNRADTDRVLVELYKRTPLQSTFGIIMLALVEGEPHLLTLKQALKVYLEHRLVVVKRRSEFELLRAKKRAHILEGLRIAIKNLDEIISIIRNAHDVETARERLIRRYALSDEQASAILDMPLKRLAALERKKIEDEYKSLIKTIKELEALLTSSKKLRALVDAELIIIKQRFNDQRRTVIVTLTEGKSATTLLTATAVTSAREVWVGITPEGIIARCDIDKSPRLSGKQAPQWVVKTNTHHTIYLLSKDGKAAALSVETLPDADSFSGGVHYSKVSPLTENGQLVTLFSVPQKEKIENECYILTATQQGMVKKSQILELPGPSANTFILVKVVNDDKVVSAVLTRGNNELALVTAQAMVIRFSEQDVRPMGLMATGVNGIKLGQADTVIGMFKVSLGENLLLLAKNGKAWSIPVEEFPIQGRYGQGVSASRLNKGVTLAGCLAGNKSQMGVVHFKRAASKQIKVGEVPTVKRLRSGFDWTDVKEDDLIIGTSQVQEMLDFWISQKTLKGQPKATKIKDLAETQNIPAKRIRKKGLS